MTVLFQIKSLAPQGTVTVSQVHAADERDALRQAAMLGHSVLSVTPASWLSRIRAGGDAGFPLLLFCQELLALIDSGITIVEAIDTLAEKEARAAVRGVLARLATAMRQGRAFSAALEELPQVFPPLFVATVRASERTSGLNEALGRYIAYGTQIAQLRARLVSAAIYPVLLIAVSALVVLFLMGYVVPRFSHIYEDMGDTLPLMSRLLLQWGQAVEGHWPVLLLLPGLPVLLLLSGGGRWLSRRVVRRLWRIPAVGERLRVFQLARLYRTLGMLLRGGIAIVPALEMVTGLLSHAMQSGMSDATRRIREGQPISQAFDAANLTTPVALRLLRVGERTGQMGDMMERTASFHDDEMSRWAEWATRLIGPVLMLLMGLVIGGIVVLMYLPIFQLAESIQ